MKKLLLAPVVLLNLISGSVQADENCFYANIGVGVAIPSHDITSSANSYGLLFSPTVPGTSFFEFPNVNWQNDLDTGFNLNLAVGYHFTDCIRGELEWIYQRFERNIGGTFDFMETDSITPIVFNTFPNNPIEEASGHLSVYSLMTNAIYDFNNCTSWTPFLGAGFGVAWFHGNGISVDSAFTTIPPVGAPITTPNLQNSPGFTGSSFAWQIKAGIAYDLKGNMSLVAQYHLFGTSRFWAKSSSIITNPNVPNVASIFTIPESSVRGLLTNMIDINLRFG